ncbi:hypothetical protein [Bosea sp. BIWAKO-01]|uniref:hypothetical protein n=1 Tax=Bosea sp. BIWAKO-01 TaxID=506668 RepID=UPI00086D82FC|nr:hypothetical protein [Bosea sp. BIWAKO-01]GAU86165.1 hypothetical protein BIWAKO_06113 [Bosea sp. BIWAKO-01]
MAPIASHSSDPVGEGAPAEHGNVCEIARFFRVTAENAMVREANPPQLDVVYP